MGEGTLATNGGTLAGGRETLAVSGRTLAGGGGTTLAGGGRGNFGFRCSAGHTYRTSPTHTGHTTTP